MNPWPQPLVVGQLLRREKRFLLHARVGSADVIAHCPNTGSLQGCVAAGQRVWLSAASDAERKLRWTWEVTEVGQALVGVNTQRANPLVKELLLDANFAAPMFAGYRHVLSEVVSAPGVRMDFAVRDGAHADGYLEVKNVTSSHDDLAFFPDAVTERGQRHLQELMRYAAAGLRAILLFCVQREDVSALRPADEIDPQYGALLRLAARRGVEIYAWRSSFSRDSEGRPVAVQLTHQIPVLLA